MVLLACRHFREVEELAGKTSGPQRRPPWRDSVLPMRKESDVIIVGSGPLGTILARRLAEAGRRVLVLEQGPPITQPPGSHLKEEPRLQKDPDAYLAAVDAHIHYLNPDADEDGLPGAYSTAAVGGQGTLWTANCPRASAAQRWDALTPAEWEAAYATAESILGVRDDQFSASTRQQRVAACLRPYLAGMQREVIDQPMAGRCDDDGSVHFTSPQDILHASAAGDAIELRRGRVTSLDHDGRRVGGVVVDGETVGADAVVVAAGVFDTPRLLHAAGIRPRALGRYLTYHPLLVSQVVLAEDLYSHESIPDDPPRLQIPPTPSHPWNTMVLRDFNPLPPAAPDLDVPPNRLLELQLMCPVDIQAENRMTMGDDGSVRFHVPLAAADHDRMKAVREDANALGAHLGRFRSGCEPQWVGSPGFAHVMGGCRMGTVDDGTSVTDPAARVWGFENLYLATVGLIPTRVAVNPTLTAAALAIRTADAITRAAS